MTYASLAAQRSQYTRNQNRVSFGDSRVSLGPISNFVVLLVLACLLAVIYLSQVIKTNNYSYSLDTLNKEKVALQEEHSSLQVDSARLQSVERVSNSEVAANLVEPEQVTLVN